MLLDASALLAYLHQEQGGSQIRQLFLIRHFGQVMLF
jgi:PIN domain nuclease of toxin-antitoxin system